KNVVAEFADPAVGVVSCFYRGIAERNFWAEVEAVGAASDFFAGAVVANLPGRVTFALGASVTTTKTWLAKIGGYEALADLAAVVAPSVWVGAGFFGAYLLFRLLVAWVVGVWGVGDEALRKKLWLVPVRDAIHFAVWLAGFVSNRVKWGGVEYAVESGNMRE